MFEEQRTSLFVWVAAAILLVALGYRLIGSRAPAAPPVEVTEPHAAERPRKKKHAVRLYVHVAGAVRRPGLYRVPKGARVATALELAGGPKPSAELTTTNLAAKVQDGQQIVVPARGAAPVAAGAPSGAGSTTGPISLASATQAQLEELDGIGPALAQAILDYRDANGGFSSIEQLQEVDGIGEVRFDALREAVVP